VSTLVLIYFCPHVSPECSISFSIVPPFSRSCLISSMWSLNAWWKPSRSSNRWHMSALCKASSTPVSTLIVGQTLKSFTLFMFVKGSGVASHRPRWSNSGTRGVRMLWCCLMSTTFPSGSMCQFRGSSSSVSSSSLSYSDEGVHTPVTLSSSQGEASRLSNGSSSSSS